MPANKARLRDEPRLNISPRVLCHAYRRGMEGQLERCRARRCLLLTRPPALRAGIVRRLAIPRPAAGPSSSLRHAFAQRRKLPFGVARWRRPRRPRDAAPCGSRFREGNCARPRAPLPDSSDVSRRGLPQAAASPRRPLLALATKWLARGSSRRRPSGWRLLAQPGPRSLLRPVAGVLSGAAPLGGADVAPPPGNVRLPGLSRVARTKDPFGHAS